MWRRRAAVARLDIPFFGVGENGVVGGKAGAGADVEQCLTGPAVRFVAREAMGFVLHRPIAVEIRRHHPMIVAAQDGLGHIGIAAGGGVGAKMIAHKAEGVA